MAQATPEQERISHYLKMVIGDLVMKLAYLEATNDLLREQLAKAQADAPKGT